MRMANLTLGMDISKRAEALQLSLAVSISSFQADFARLQLPKDTTDLVIATVMLQAKAKSAPQTAVGWTPSGTPALLRNLAEDHVGNEPKQLGREPAVH